MKFSLLTYNVLFNKAFTELEPILEKYKPDLLCLQEVDTSEKNLLKLEKKGYQLADYSNSLIQFGRIFGVATYYNQSKFNFLESGIIDLPRSIYELLLILIKGGKRRTVLKTDFTLMSSNKKLTIYNVHLSLYGINSIRMKQIRKTLNDINITEKTPVIITGDFNYFPYRRKRLENLMKKYRFFEATRSINYTITYTPSQTDYNRIQKLAAWLIRKFWNGRLKVDYIFYKRLRHKKTERIDIKLSDHFPILSSFEFR